jgi:hypothetical protein
MEEPEALWDHQKFNLADNMNHMVVNCGEWGGGGGGRGPLYRKFIFDENLVASTFYRLLFDSSFILGERGQVYV